MPNKKKTLESLYALEYLGKPMQIKCKCGDVHSVLKKDFDLTGIEIKPKELVRLKCVYYFEELEKILEADTEISIQAKFGNPIQKLIGNALIKFYIWKLNKMNN